MQKWIQNALDVSTLKGFKQNCKEMVTTLKRAGYDYVEAKLFYIGEMVRLGWIYQMGLTIRWFDKWWRKL